MLATQGCGCQGDGSVDDTRGRFSCVTDGFGISYGKSVSNASISAYIVRTSVKLEEYDSQEIMFFLNSHLDDNAKEYLNKYVFKDYVLIPGSVADNYDDYVQDFIESGYADKWYKDGGYCE